MHRCNMYISIEIYSCRSQGQPGQLTLTSKMRHHMYPGEKKHQSRAVLVDYVAAAL